MKGCEPLQMDDYGMDKRHYDCCNNCNGHESNLQNMQNADNHVEPDKTEEDETTDLS